MAAQILDGKAISAELRGAIAQRVARLREKGVSITPDNLKISDRAIMVLPIHPAQRRV